MKDISAHCSLSAFSLINLFFFFFSVLKSLFEPLKMLFISQRLLAVGGVEGESSFGSHGIKLARSDLYYF